MTQTHDEELVEQVAKRFYEIQGLRSDKPDLTPQEEVILRVAIPLITHKAKEEGKAELLKQMMEPSVKAMKRGAKAANSHRAEHGLPENIVGAEVELMLEAVARTFATEQGLTISEGEK